MIQQTGQNHQLYTHISRLSLSHIHTHTTFSLYIPTYIVSDVSRTRILHLHPRDNVRLAQIRQLSDVEQRRKKKKFGHFRVQAANRILTPLKWNHFRKRCVEAATGIINNGIINNVSQKYNWSFLKNFEEESGCSQGSKENSGIFKPALQYIV